MCDWLVSISASYQIIRGACAVLYNEQICVKLMLRLRNSGLVYALRHYRSSTLVIGDGALEDHEELKSPNDVLREE